MKFVKALKQTALTAAAGSVLLSPIAFDNTPAQAAPLRHAVTVHGNDYNDFGIRVKDSKGREFDIFPGAGRTAHTASRGVHFTHVYCVSSKRIIEVKSANAKGAPTGPRRFICPKKKTGYVSIESKHFSTGAISLWGAWR